MSTTAKIIYILLAIFTVGLGIEGYFYFQALQKPKSVSFPTPSGNEAPKLIDITGKAIIGNLNLFDITKDQVAEWAKAGGIIEVSAYSGPLPTLPADIPTSFSAQIPGSSLSRPTSVRIIAGYFRSTQGGSIIVSQGGKELILIPNQNARLWIKNGDKIQIVSTQLDKLIYSKELLEFIKINDSVLIPNVTEPLNELTTSTIIIFK